MWGVVEHEEPRVHEGRSYWCLLPFDVQVGRSSFDDLPVSSVPHLDFVSPLSCDLVEGHLCDLEWMAVPWPSSRGRAYLPDIGLVSYLDVDPCGPSLFVVSLFLFPLVLLVSVSGIPVMFPDAACRLAGQLRLDVSVEK